MKQPIHLGLPITLTPTYRVKNHLLLAIRIILSTSGRPLVVLSTRCTCVLSVVAAATQRVSDGYIPQKCAARCDAEQISIYHNRDTSSYDYTIDEQGILENTNRQTNNVWHTCRGPRVT